uniref:uncharacterized protein LOC120345298 n=1 Tax=Styela clava TaxID=7725 RepID=UPI00193A9D47|nr:uncharacterized protein LOC120345298 [Styela clava]
MDITYNSTDAADYSSNHSIVDSTLFKTMSNVFVTISSLMMLANLWVVVAFFLYAKSSNIMKKKSKTDLDGGLIFKAALAAVTLPLLRFAATTMIFFIGFDPENHKACAAGIYISNIFFVVPILALYVFLYIRQRSFYNHPSLGNLFDRSVATFSKISLAFIVIPTVVSLVIEMSINQYKSGPHGCSFRSDQSDINFRFFIYGGVLAFGQAISLGLFIYPLYLHSKSQNKTDERTNKVDISSHDHAESSSADLDSNAAHKVKEMYNSMGELTGTAASSTCSDGDFKWKHLETDNMENFALPPLDDKRISTDEKQVVTSDALEVDKHSRIQVNRRRESTVYRLIRRTLYLASISILSDMTVMIVSGLLVPKNTPYYVIGILHDLDTTVNIITIVGSFRAWRKILFGSFAKYR